MRADNAPLRSMHPSTLERALITGPAGTIEVDINDAGSGRRAIAVVTHPDPTRGGTKDNKVVTTLARVFFSQQHVVLRPNFRGVGATTGAHDEGRGETDDILAVIDYARQRFGDLPLRLAGFSFGTYVQARVAQRVAPQWLVLVGPAVMRFKGETVGPQTLVVHGENDEVVPLAAVLDWARPQNLPIVVVPGGDHFFHGRLGLLAQIVLSSFR